MILAHSSVGLAGPCHSDSSSSAAIMLFALYFFMGGCLPTELASGRLMLILRKSHVGKNHVIYV